MTVFVAIWCDIIRKSPFDATFNDRITIKDLDEKKIVNFVRTARSRRGFRLSEDAPIEDILTHLNLFEEERIRNAAALLFGKDPQRFFINSEVRCAYFHGTEIAKPIPSYKVFGGDVFELVDQSVDFILSKLNYAVGTRKEEVQVPGGYEIPKEIVAEAIVNAVAHRDYTSNASVQVMLFKDRLEIMNPGSLPMGWTIEKLKKIHQSIPANPLLAHPMYLAGYIERLGTGTADIIRIAKEVGLKEPEFVQEDSFKVIIYRPEATGQATGQVTGQVTGQADDPIKRLVSVMEGELKRSDIMDQLQLKHRETFNSNYLDPAIKEGYIEMTHPENPTHPKQRYKLTAKGKDLKSLLK